MSTTTNAREVPRTTMRPWYVICSTVAASVVSSPHRTLASESPTRMRSTPAASTSEAKSAS